MQPVAAFSEGEKSIRKKWLIFFLITIILVQVLGRGIDLLIVIRAPHRDIYSFASLAAVRAVFRLLVLYIYYYCAYKKSGTRLLTCSLIIAPGLVFIEISAIFSTFSTVIGLIITVFFFTAVTCWYYYSFKLRKINKILQLQTKSTTSGRVHAEQNDPIIKPKRKKSKTKIFCWVLIMIIGSFSLNSILSLSESAERQGYMFGSVVSRSLIFASILYAIWWLCTKKKQGKLLCFTIVFAVLASDPIIARIINHQRAKAYIDFDSFMEEVMSLKGELPTESNKKKNSMVTKYGEAAPIFELMQKFFVSAKENEKIFRKEGFDLENILAPETLCDEENMSAARKGLQKFRETIEGLSQGVPNLCNEFEKILNTTHNFNVLAFVEGCIEKINEMTPMLQEYYKIEYELISEVDKTLEFLVEINEDYWFEDDMVTFLYEEDLSTYLSRIQNIETLCLEEDSVVDILQKRKEQFPINWFL